MTSYPVLSEGDRGSHVQFLQKRLNDWGCNAGETDGIFGQKTEEAVKLFQSKRQTVTFARSPLAIDGIVGAETWAELTKTPVQDIEIIKHVELLSKSAITHICGRMPTTAQYEDINACLNKFEINTPQRMRHFIAQVAHESGGLRWTEELASGWAYEFRFDLGNVYPGDGPKYKGGGFIQLTGRSNYAAFAKYMDDPKILEIGCKYVGSTYPASSAGFWWMNNNMNALCDSPTVTVRDVTRRVNGGYNGLSDRIYYYNRACEVIR